MNQIKRIILKNVFRKEENWEKVLFIQKNTNLSVDFILKAATVSRANDYHNFGHQIGATEMAIKISHAEGIEKDDTTLLAAAMLFHDASHRGIVQVIDEMVAFQAMETLISENDIQEISEQPYFKVMSESRDLIIATTFSLRGKMASLKERIVQDADLAHLGQGPVYWMWASMGLVDEFNRQRNTTNTPVEFIRNEQEKFIKFLVVLGKGHVYLTEGARKIFRDPATDLSKVMAYNDAQIEFAYRVRKDDITLKVFEEQLLALG